MEGLFDSLRAFGIDPFKGTQTTASQIGNGTPAYPSGAFMPEFNSPWVDTKKQGLYGLGGQQFEGGGGDGFNWEGAGSIATGVAGLAEAYMGYLNYGLSRDQFDFTKKAINRNIADNATDFNNRSEHQSIIQNSTRDVARISGAPLTA